jgi:negative regulator of sigma E activity
MSELDREELISAYLDGELAGQDLARAERLLAEDPDARQLLAELESLRHSLRSLPWERLPDDFSRRTVERAYQAAQGEEQHIAIVAPDKPARGDGREPWRVNVQRLWRPLIYIGVATAAAVFISLFPRDHRPRIAAVRDERKQQAGSARTPYAQPAAAASPEGETLRKKAAPRDAELWAAPAVESLHLAAPPAADEVLLVEGNTTSADAGTRYLNWLLTANSIHVEQRSTQQVPFDPTARQSTRTARTQNQQFQQQLNFIVAAEQSQLDAVVTQLKQGRVDSPIKDVAVRSVPAADLPQLGVMEELPQSLVPSRDLRQESPRGAGGATESAEPHSESLAVKRRGPLKEAAKPEASVDSRPLNLDQGNFDSLPCQQSQIGANKLQQRRAVFILREEAGK